MAVCERRNDRPAALARSEAEDGETSDLVVSRGMTAQPAGEEDRERAIAGPRSASHASALRRLIRQQKGPHGCVDQSSQRDHWRRHLAATMAELPHQRFDTSSCIRPLAEPGEPASSAPPAITSTRAELDRRNTERDASEPDTAPIFCGQPILVAASSVRPAVGHRKLRLPVKPRRRHVEA
jgi:hypothetical protein